MKKCLTKYAGTYAHLKSYTKVFLTEQGIVCLGLGWLREEGCLPDNVSGAEIYFATQTYPVRLHNKDYAIWKEARYNYGECVFVCSSIIKTNICMLMYNIHAADKSETDVALKYGISLILAT